MVSGGWPTEALKYLGLYLLHAMPHIIVNGGTEYVLDDSLIEHLSPKERLAARLRALDCVDGPFLTTDSHPDTGMSLAVKGTHRREVTRAIHEEGFVILDVAAKGPGHEYDHYLYVVSEDSDSL